VPFNDLEANERPSAFLSRIRICGWQLFHVPHDGELDDGNIQPQHHRVYVDGNAYVPDPDSLRLLPCEQ